MIWFLLSSAALATVTVADNATRCLECVDVPHPGDCITTTTCTDGQTCVVEQFITSGGLVLFNSGCQSRQRCSRSRRRDIPQYSSLSKRSDIITCDECCEGDFCNDKGCGIAAVKQPQRGALCFQCDVEAEPDTCRQLDKCDFGEVCMLTMLPNKAPDGGDLYKTACASPRVCTAYASLGRKRTTFCHVCCSDDFCNDRCEVQIARAQALPPTTTPTTTTSTTTTSTTTTTTPKPTTTITTTTPKPTTTTTTTRPKPKATSTTTTSTAATTTTTTTTTPKRPTTTTTTTPKPTITTTTTLKPTTTTTTTTARTTTSRQAHCNQLHYHYDLHSDLCYKFYNQHSKWDAANNVCKHDGGTLAVIDTQAKWDFLKKTIPHFIRHQKIYIGAKTHYHGSNTFYWQNGHRVTQTHWAHGEPNGHGTQDCVYLNYSENYAWHDMDCYENYVFICTIQ